MLDYLRTYELIKSVVSCDVTYFDDYKTELTQRMAEAWNCAREQIKNAQKRQRQQHDKHTKYPDFQVWERVFLNMPVSLPGSSRAHST